MIKKKYSTKYWIYTSMINYLTAFDKYLLFTFLIIIFQCFHSISLNSFTQEFLIQLIPYTLVINSFLFSEKFFKFIKRYFAPLIIFNFICTFSVFWTTDLKYTIASNLDLFLSSFTIIIAVYYSKNKINGLKDIVKSSLFAIYFIIFLGIFSINVQDRTFLGLSPSLFSSILNYGSVCSLYLFTKTKRKYHIVSFCIFLILSLILGSVRGVLSILIGLTAYLKLFNSKKEITFYLKLILSLTLVFIIYLLVILNIDISSPFLSFLSGFKFKNQLLTNSQYLKIALQDIFSKKEFNISNHMYAGERISSIIIGLRETFTNSPIIGFGHGNSKEVFTEFGKSYSHNGLIDVYMGTGLFGLYFYMKFIFSKILRSTNKIGVDLISWKRFSSIVFLFHLMVGLPFENIPLSLLLALIISV